MNTDIGWPDSRDGLIVSCVRTGTWSAEQRYESGRFIRKTSFELPASADQLFLLSRGAMSHGQLSIRQDDGGHKSVRVDVQVKYASEDVLDKASVCLLSRGESSRGVGIYVRIHSMLHAYTENGLQTPDNWHPNHGVNLSFEVTVHIPSIIKSIKDLSTDMSIFTTNVWDMGSTHFEAISLKTTNSPIDVQTLRATDLVLRTTNAAITGTYVVARTAEIVTKNGNIGGTFNASDSLRLVTENARIAATVHLYNDGARPTYFAALTNNG